MVSNLVRFDKDGLELIINQETGEVFASQSAIEKPKSLEDSLLLYAQALVEQKRKLENIEEKKIPLLEAQVSLLKNQVALLEDQNQLLKQENNILKEKMVDVELEQETQKMEITAHTCELRRFKNGQGYWHTILS